MTPEQFQQPRPSIGRRLEIDFSQTQFTLLSDAEIRERIAHIRNPSTIEAARVIAHQEIIHSCLKMIPYAVYRWAPQNIPDEELIGEAFEIVNRSVTTFNPEYRDSVTGQAVAFQHYVFDSLEAGLRSPRTYERPNNPIRMPEWTWEYQKIFKQARVNCITSRGYSPSPAEWYAEALDLIGKEGKRPVGQETFEGIRIHGIEKPYVPIQFLAEKEDATGQGEINYQAEADLERIEDVVTVEKLLRDLTERERTVLMLWFGLDPEQEQLTLQEISEKLGGITWQRVQQIKERAVKRLQAAVSRESFVAEAGSTNASRVTARTQKSIANLLRLAEPTQILTVLDNIKHDPGTGDITVESRDIMDTAAIPVLRCLKRLSQEHGVSTSSVAKTLRHCLADIA